MEGNLCVRAGEVHMEGRLRLLVLNEYEVRI